jgi:hypothetical protein
MYTIGPTSSQFANMESATTRTALCSATVVRPMPISSGETLKRAKNNEIAVWRKANTTVIAAAASSHHEALVGSSRFQNRLFSWSNGISRSYHFVIAVCRTK